MPGDGIGRTVLEETLRILDVAGFEATYVNADIGWEFWKAEGNPLQAGPLICFPGIKSGFLERLHRNPRKRLPRNWTPHCRDRDWSIPVRLSD